MVTVYVRQIKATHEGFVYPVPDEYLGEKWDDDFIIGTVEIDGVEVFDGTIAVLTWGSNGIIESELMEGTEVLVPHSAEVIHECETAWKEAIRYRFQAIG